MADASILARPLAKLPVELPSLIAGRLERAAAQPR
jgi:hypothetical protein